MGSKRLKIHLVIIDPQNDFLANDDGSPYSVDDGNGKSLVAALPVKGAVADMERVARLIVRVGKKLDDIHV